MSSFNRFFVYHLENSKFNPFPTYFPLGSRTRLVSRKNTMVINFAQSQVLIDFLCSVLKIQNTSHSQRISPWEVIQTRFCEKKLRS
ncbi:hypothetical protein BHM03_00002743 [Ensete ventricosum]|nr:hypothetical protein BHM03_00002743 [Ensete ventricosum]